jgi:DnaJ-class molecular chaperone
VLGGEVDVLTLDGMVTMKVPAGTQPDAQLMLRGKGVRHIGHSTKRGNQYVKLQLKIPTKMTPRQLELMEEFRREELGLTGSDAGKTTGKQEHSSFTINQAWNRLKEFIENKKDCDNDAQKKTDNDKK